MLLGVTGDQVLDKDVYKEIKASTLKQVRGTVQADILKKIRPKIHVYFLRIRLEANGRCSRIFYRQGRSEFLFSFYFGISYRRSW